MRTLLIATAALSGLAATPAAAQVVTGGYGTNVQVGRGGAVYGLPSPGWGGGYVGGRWQAGTRAPGGWNAYRRPQRGWTVPGYWRQPDFRVRNHAAFGLGAPPPGYGWSRYYDDAVLMNDYGQVYDSVSGVDWRRVDQPYPSGYGYPNQGYAVAPNGYDAGYPGGYDGGGYGPSADPNCRPRKRGSGLGGALLGGALGAGIGAATGGLGTVLIAGGAGALAGQAIDRSSQPRYECYYGPDGQNAGYVDGGGYNDGYNGGGYVNGGGGGYSEAGDGYAYAQGGGGGGGVVFAPSQQIVQPIPPEYGYQTGYQQGWIPGSTATATVEFGRYRPETTTTTTTTVTEEYVTEPVRYRKVVHKPARKWRPAPRCYC